VLRIKHQALEDIMSQDGELVVNLLQHFALMMSGRLNDMNDKLSALAKDSRLSDTLPTVSLDQDKHLIDYWPEANPASASADLKATLLTLPGIENFSPKDINILARNATVTLYPPRHVFTHQGERCSSIFLVLDGAVLMRGKMPVSDTVEEKILNIGEWFSLTSLVPNMTAFETVTAPKHVLVASITRDDFNRISEESLAVTRFFLFMLVNELARKVQSTFADMQAA
jgi:CRP-like cAMP-binding protein